MEVNVAKTAGFCFGVKRAVDQVYEQTEKENGKKIYTYGDHPFSWGAKEDL